jgi:hypothetical protein
MTSPIQDPVSLEEAVAQAIDAVQLWTRFNDWTSDREEGLPIEVCRYGMDDEPEIVVVARYPATEDEGDVLSREVSLARARAALAHSPKPPGVEGLREAVARMIAADCVGGWEFSEDAPDDAYDKAVAEQTPFFRPVADRILALLPSPADPDLLVLGELSERVPRGEWSASDLSVWGPTSWHSHIRLLTAEKHSLMNGTDSAVLTRLVAGCFNYVRSRLTSLRGKAN